MTNLACASVFGANACQIPAKISLKEVALFGSIQNASISFQLSKMATDIAHFFARTPPDSKGKQEQQHEASSLDGKCQHNRTTAVASSKAERPLHPCNDKETFGESARPSRSWCESQEKFAPSVAERSFRASLFRFELMGLRCASIFKP